MMEPTRTVKFSWHLLHQYQHPAPLIYRRAADCIEIPAVWAIRAIRPVDRLECFARRIVIVVAGIGSEAGRGHFGYLLDPKVADHRCSVKVIIAAPIYDGDVKGNGLVWENGLPRMVSTCWDIAQLSLGRNKVRHRGQLSECR